MKCCVSRNVGTWTNWLTFEPDPDYNPDAGTELFLRYRISAATRNFITSGKSHVYVLAPVAAARRGFKMVLFIASRGNTFVGGTCALTTALTLLASVISQSLVKIWLWLWEMLINHSKETSAMLREVEKWSEITDVFYSFFPFFPVIFNGLCIGSVSCCCCYFMDFYFSYFFRIRGRITTKS